MPDDPVDALIERIVRAARISDSRGRDDLRRELWTHFEEAGPSPDLRNDAVRRFGSESVIAESFRQVYRGDYALRYAGKLAASLVASAAAALLIEAAVNLRIGLAAAVWRWSPGFSHGAALAVAVVLALVAIGEAARPPADARRATAVLGAYAAVAAAVSLLLADAMGAFAIATLLALGSCASRLVTTRAAKLLVTVAVFATAQYALHWMLHVHFGPARALAAGGVLAAVWASTVAIVSGVDRLFGSTVTPI